MGSVKRLLPVGAALLLKLGITAAFFWFPARQLLEQAGNDKGIYFTLVLDFLLFLLTLFHFGTASTIDPGVIPRTTDEEEDSSLAPLYHNVVIRDVNVQMKWCTTCKFYRPPRSSHCSVCDSCVQNFDHHCPWLGNCIGRRNYRFFYWYLCCLTAHMVITFTCSCLYIFNTMRAPMPFPDSNIIVNKWSTAPVIASIVICILVFIFFFFVCGLMAFHTFLITNGRSTYEQFSNRYQHQTPFDYGIKKNWIKAFCSPIPPSLMPPEPYIEINHTPQQHKYANYPGPQYSVTVRNQQNNSQKVHLLQENDDNFSIGACSMNGELVSDKENGHLVNNRADSLANMPLSLSTSIQNLTQKTKESGLVCTLPQEDSTFEEPPAPSYDQIRTHDTIVKVKHTDF